MHQRLSALLVVFLTVMLQPLEALAQTQAPHFPTTAAVIRPGSGLRMMWGGGGGGGGGVAVMACP